MPLDDSLEARIARRDHAVELKRRALRIADLYGNAKGCFDRGETEDGEHLLGEAHALVVEAARALEAPTVPSDPVEVSPGAPLPYTAEEVRANFVARVRDSIRLWAHDPRPKDLQARLDGLAYSFLVMLDGELDIPKFRVVADPHPDDKAFAQSEGERWYPPVEEGEDIAGGLHDLFCQGLGPRGEVTTSMLTTLIARLVPIWRAQRGPDEPPFAIELDDGSTVTLVLTAPKES